MTLSQQGEGLEVSRRREVIGNKYRQERKGVEGRVCAKWSRM